MSRKRSLEYVPRVSMKFHRNISVIIIIIINSENEERKILEDTL